MNPTMQKKPDWLRVRLPGGERYQEIKERMRRLDLHTVCEEARCPNVGECWSEGTATIMILGETCTRGCRFCAVNTGDPAGVVDPREPENVGRALGEMGLAYVVLTIGQYLRPSPKHAEVQRWVEPAEFDRYRDAGLAMGFKFVASGPLVRSSYRAAEAFLHGVLKGGEVRPYEDRYGKKTHLPLLR